VEKDQRRHPGAANALDLDGARVTMIHPFVQAPRSNASIESRTEAAPIERPGRSAFLRPH
jgi:hypothetical protein